MNKSSEAVKQCNIYRSAIKKLNKQVEGLQAKLIRYPPEEESVPY
jgi:hypothetical protein